MTDRPDYSIETIAEHLAWISMTAAELRWAVHQIADEADRVGLYVAVRMARRALEMLQLFPERDMDAGLRALLADAPVRSPEREPDDPPAEIT